MKKIIFIVLSILLICGCGTKDNSQKSKLDEILEKNNYIVVDVRTNEEYDEGHVVDSINIPYDEIDEDTDLDKDKTILVYCKSGKRSKIAYDKLVEYGYDVYDLGAYDSVTLKKE